MKKFSEKFLKEQYERENRYFKVYDHYRPNYYKASITSKFYSKYDAIDFAKADLATVEAIKNAIDKGPKDKYNWPVTESQCYGWFTEPLVELDRNDNRLYAPRVASHITRHELKLKMDRTMDIPKFSGIPFRH